MNFFRRNIFKIRISVIVTVAVSIFLLAIYYINLQNNASVNNSKVINDITVLKNETFSIKELLNSFKTERANDFYENHENKVTKTIIKKINFNLELVEKIYNHPYFENEEESSYLDDFLKNLHELEKKHSLLIDIYLKIGNKNTGYIQEYEFRRKELNQKIKLFGTPKIRKEYEKLQQRINEFSQTSEISEIELNKYIKQFLQVNKTYSLTKITRANIEDALNEYLNIVFIIKQTTQKVGENNKTGLFREMYLYMNNMQEDLDELKVLLNDIHNKSENLISLKIRIVVISAIILFVLLFFFFTVNLNRQVAYIQRMSEQISTGKFEARKNKARGVFFDIYKNLNFHQKQLEHKRDFIESIINEDFETNLELDDNVDDVNISLKKLHSFLLVEKEKVKREKEEREIADKHAKSLAKFGRLMRTYSSNRNILANKVISDLIDYLKASIGGIYLIDEENPEKLYLAASYAYGKTKRLNAEVNLGEGIIGTCAKEKTSFYFDNIPNNYINIISGFGNTKPKILFVTPIMLANKLYGVVEIATLKNFSEKEIAFIESLCEDIASTLS